MSDPGEVVNLPPRIFLYTLDQVATILAMPITTLKRSHVYYQGRSTGQYRSHLIRSRNIGVPGGTPEWRIAEAELIRWMKLKGFRFRNTDTLLG